MRIYDFKDFKPLDDLLDKMNAKESDTYNFEHSWDHLTDEELAILSTKGIELSIEELEKCIQADGSFEWKGQKVLVYIKEQWVKNEYDDREYKYHIANCTTQVNMRLQGRINRYVISTRKDGVFEVTLRNSHTRRLMSENIEKPMNICKNCLNTMLGSYPRDYNFFNYYDFELAVFLKKYSTKLRHLPEFNNKTAPKDDYPDNWKEISQKYRTNKGWKCEECGLDCNNNKSFLHCHHIGPKYDSNYGNLQALCKDCHRKKPGHNNMK